MKVVCFARDLGKRSPRRHRRERRVEWVARWARQWAKGMRVVVKLLPGVVARENGKDREERWCGRTRWSEERTQVSVMCVFVATGYYVGQWSAFTTCIPLKKKYDNFQTPPS